MIVFWSCFNIADVLSGMLLLYLQSEEDKQLVEELNMLVERLTVSVL